MKNIEIALKIALEAYGGLTDKAGQAYIYHPLRLMHTVKTEDQKIVALLHDVIEDSEFTASDLLERGLPQQIVDAVAALTKQPGEDYMAFVARAKNNSLAKVVKIADIEDNLNVLRLNKLSSKDFERIDKYHQAWHYLNQQ